MVKKKNNPAGDEYGLLVYPNLGALSALQSLFAARSIRCVVARDMPTALLALSQYFFNLVIVNVNISEEGDGWALGGVARLIFQDAYIGVVTNETSVLTLQAAINHGLNQTYHSELGPEELVSAVLADRENLYHARPSIH